MGGNDVRALTDANSVSTTELTKLIDYYRGSRPNTIRWRDFVSDFAGISSESGTVSSRGRRTRLDLDVDPLERQLRKILSAAKKKGLGIEEAFDHFDEDMPVELLPDMLTSIQRYSKYHEAEDGPPKSQNDVIPLSIMYEVLQKWDSSLAVFESLSS